MESGALLEVRVVSADRMVWEGQAESLVARTVDGDIGILPNHEPLLATLVAGKAEIITVDGNREVVAVDGGFISVTANTVALLSQFATLAAEVDLEHARLDFAEAKRLLDAGDNSAENTTRYQRAKAQLAAAEHHTDSH